MGEMNLPFFQSLEVDKDESNGNKESSIITRDYDIKVKAVKEKNPHSLCNPFNPCKHSSPILNKKVVYNKHLINMETSCKFLHGNFMMNLYF